MTDQNWRDLLDKLQDELDRTEVTDEASREKLRNLQADVHDLRERSGDKIDSDEPLLERLQDSIEHFETSHPELTMTLSQMMTILSNAGI
jgi:hypothetical protein